MTTPIAEHIDVAISSLQILKGVCTNEEITNKLSEKDKKEFLKILFSKLKSQIQMMELYLK